MLSNDDLIHIRRRLHQIPELALKEEETHDFLLETIQTFPQTNLSYREIEGLPTAILVRVAGSNPERTIGYRADIDALPVEENTGLAFASENEGRMHACGHDIHMTVALGTLSYYADNQPKDNLIFFFQPAEESEGGGKIAYEKNAFSGEWRPDEFYALHDTPTLPAGTIGCRMGTLFAGTSEVVATLTGKGGHAAYPHQANDMVVAVAQFINQVQTIISRSIDPIESGVITFGKLRAGEINNVIAGKAVLEGTMRGLTQTMLEDLTQRVRDIGEGIARSYNCQVDVDFKQDAYYPVENTPALTAKFIDFMGNDASIDFETTPPAMTGEDFGYLIHQIPGTMFWLGVGETSSLHSATFKPDEAAIEKGIHAITSYLNWRMTTGEAQDV